MNELSKEQYARIQHCEVEQVNCINCFYYKPNTKYCFRSRIAILNTDQACQKFLYERKCSK